MYIWINNVDQRKMNFDFKLWLEFFFYLKRQVNSP